MAERLRRLTRNQIPSGSVGSNPTDREEFFFFFRRQSNLIGFVLGVVSMSALSGINCYHHFFYVFNTISGLAWSSPLKSISPYPSIKTYFIWKICFLTTFWVFFPISIITYHHLLFPSCLLLIYISLCLFQRFVSLMNTKSVNLRTFLPLTKAPQQLSWNLFQTILVLHLNAKQKRKEWAKEELINFEWRSELFVSIRLFFLLVRTRKSKSADIYVCFPSFFWD